MKNGSIYKFKKPKGRHPFVFIRMVDEYTFVGCMITHSPNSEDFKQNIKMCQEHFCIYKPDSKIRYKLQYDSSNLVRLYLIKQTDEVNEFVWGELTDAGVKFVENEVVNEQLTYWSNK